MVMRSPSCEERWARRSARAMSPESAALRAAWPWLALMTLAWCLAQWLSVAAYRAAAPPLIAPFSYSQLLWATLLGLLVFGHWPDAISLLANGGGRLSRDIIVIGQNAGDHVNRTGAMLQRQAAVAIRLHAGENIIRPRSRGIIVEIARLRGCGADESEQGGSKAAHNAIL